MLSCTSAVATPQAAVARWTARFTDRADEAAFRATTHGVERATLRVAALVVAAVDVVAGISDIAAGALRNNSVYVAAQLAGLLVCTGIWVWLRRERPRYWRLAAMVVAQLLIVTIVVLVWFGIDTSFRGALLVPSGVLVVYLAVRLDLITLTVCANTYAIGTFAAWIHVAQHTSGSQVAFLATLTGVAHAAGFIECRRLQRERRVVFAHQRMLTDISRRDELTGLSNRRCFYHTGDNLLAATAATPGCAAILLIDLDRFKEINDTLGHAAGDVLLAEVAARLAQALPDTTALARLGGDEFAALLTRSEPAADGWPAAQARCFAAVMDEPFDLSGMSLHVKASIGIAVQDNRQDRATLLRQADVAMYQAKRSGVGIETYHAEADQHSRQHIQMASQLDRALTDGQIVLYYQPKTSLIDNRTRSVEALIRWQHPTLGLLTPDKFLPVAETHGLMRKLTLRVMEMALIQAESWHDLGYDIRVAVNLAPTNLLDARFPADVAALLETTGVPARALQLEITENTIMVDPDRILSVITALGDMGFTFALADYGTGYSSLSYLSILPIDDIKIDRSFVTDLADNAHNRIIVKSTIHMAHQLGFTVIAEGIEDQRTWQHLVDLSCDTGQGYFLSRPVPAAGIEEWLQQRDQTERVVHTESSPGS